MVLFDDQPRIHRRIPDVQSGAGFSLAAPVCGQSRAHSGFTVELTAKFTALPGDFCSSNYWNLEDELKMNYRCGHMELNSVVMYTRVCAFDEVLVASRTSRAAGSL